MKILSLGSSVSGSLDLSGNLNNYSDLYTDRSIVYGDRVLDKYYFYSELLLKIFLGQNIWYDVVLGLVYDAIYNVEWILEYSLSRIEYNCFGLELSKSMYNDTGDSPSMN